MKKVNLVQDEDPQEKTIRPNYKFIAKPEKQEEPSRPRSSRSSPRKRSGSNHHKHHSRAKSSASNKFELPPRPDVICREQSIEDYSEVFEDSDGLISQKLSLKKVFPFMVIIIACISLIFNAT